MGDQKTETTTPPPRLIGSLRAGFDTVAEHISLIILPILLDLLLWFGPRFNLKALFDRAALEVSQTPGLNAPEVAEMAQAAQRSWAQLGEAFNLTSVLRTYPVGLPSLLAFQSTGETPLGAAPLISIGSGVNAVLAWGLFTVVGLLLGSQYFRNVATAVPVRRSASREVSSLWAALQVVVLTLASAVLLVMLGIPAVFLLSLLAMVSTTMAQFATLLLSVMLVWALIPLAFSPHGIFLYRQNAVFSMLNSLRLTRFILPSTGLFFISLLVLSQGLDLLWQVPPHGSWLLLVGIAGHAFVTTALLASSFHYYRDAMSWVAEVLARAGQKSMSPLRNSTR